MKAKGGQYDADAVIIATGTSRTTPRIKGIHELEGMGISYCAVCDAFFYRGKNVAVLGNGEYAVHEALELKPVVGSVTLLTNGKPMEAAVPEGIEVIEKEIEAFEGEEVLEGVLFRDGTRKPFSGVFIAVGVAGSTDLARKLGAIAEEQQDRGGRKYDDFDPWPLCVAGDCTDTCFRSQKPSTRAQKLETEAVKYLRGIKPGQVTCPLCPRFVL